VDIWDLYETYSTHDRRGDLTEEQSQLLAVCDFRQEMNSGGFDTYLRYWGADSASEALAILPRALGVPWRQVLVEALPFSAPPTQPVPTTAPRSSTMPLQMTRWACSTHASTSWKVRRTRILLLATWPTNSGRGTPGKARNQSAGPGAHGPPRQPPSHRHGRARRSMAERLRELAPLVIPLPQSCLPWHVCRLHVRAPEHDHLRGPTLTPHLSHAPRPRRRDASCRFLRR
jgi:hypothetical protein